MIYEKNTTVVRNIINDTRHVSKIDMTWYVIDGMDGSGKTTTAYSLRDILESRGRNVVVYNNPSVETRIGRLTLTLLRKNGTIALVFATSFFFISIIQSLIKMKTSKNIDDHIFVRYTLSAAYLPKKLVLTAYKIMTCLLPTPDIKMYKDVEVEDALKRIEERGDEREMFENVDALSNTREKMSIITKDWIKIDRKFTPDEVDDDLIRIIDSI